MDWNIVGCGSHFLCITICTSLIGFAEIVCNYYKFRELPIKSIQEQNPFHSFWNQCNSYKVAYIHFYLSTIPTRILVCFMYCFRVIMNILSYFPLFPGAAFLPHHTPCGLRLPCDCMAAQATPSCLPLKCTKTRQRLPLPPELSPILLQLPFGYCCHFLPLAP